MPLTSDMISVSIFAGKLDAKDSTLLTLKSGTPAFDAMCSYPDLLSEKATGCSFSLAKASNDEAIDNDEEEDGAGASCKHVKLALGLGAHAVTWNGKEFFVAAQALGPPVGTNCGVQLYDYVTVGIAGKGKQAVLRDFVDHVIEVVNTNTDTKTIQVYTWHTRYHYWKREKRHLKRPLESVILHQNTKRAIIEDMEDFKNAKEWYFRHGIPYKRCYMFYGPPGTGKSSTIKALASNFDRSLCFLQPSDKDCTDESFKKAIENAPKNALIAIEDIDALFDRNRRSLNSRCPLTFSGLLNGVDGIGAPNGLIIMMTTNYMDRLDPALTRAGRCDMTVRLDHASSSQMKKMFLRFYPGEEKEAGRFVEELKGVKSLNMASLQNHFIVHRKSSAKLAVDKLCIRDGNLMLIPKGSGHFSAEENEKESKQKRETAEKKEAEKVILPSDPRKWTDGDVLSWARRREGLNKGIEKQLQFHGIDGQVLVSYGEKEMLEDGLKKRGDRVKLARAIEMLKKGELGSLARAAKASNSTDATTLAEEE